MRVTTQIAIVYEPSVARWFVDVCPDGAAVQGQSGHFTLYVDRCPNILYAGAMAIAIAMQSPTAQISIKEYEQ